MSQKVRIENKWLPSLYASYYPILRDIAMEHGYALAIHGSLQRDFDLVAIAWTSEARDPLDLLTSLSKKIGAYYDDGKPYDSMEHKPHGRIAFTIDAGGGGYFDISIIPPVKNNQ
ncbi:MAG: hypothetical protein L0Y80_12025 [Ignavibacteriae bacterium]|nr:hypothetical protein [Ignavibacteriota bacterium]